jgi:glycosyltransferase involved in cell wall biosynthesis
VSDASLPCTAGHADYFHDVLGVPRARLLVLPVGADESVFRPVPPRTLAHDERVRLLFYGSFIRLHGVPTIVAALRVYAGPPMHCRFIGEGPMRAESEAALRELDPARVDVEFEDWLAFEALPERIAAADIVLGIFGTTSKALRVVPNKVYQALAAGRPVITADTPAYDESFRTVDPAAIGFVPPGDASALSGLLADWAAARDRLAARGQAAANVFERAFAESRLRERLMSGHVSSRRNGKCLRGCWLRVRSWPSRSRAATCCSACWQSLQDWRCANRGRSCSGRAARCWRVQRSACRSC